MTPFPVLLPDRHAAAVEGRASVLIVPAQVLEHPDAEPIAGRLWIVDEQRMRIHPVEPGPR